MLKSFFIIVIRSKDQRFARGKECDLGDLIALEYFKFSFSQFSAIFEWVIFFSHLICKFSKSFFFEREVFKYISDVSHLLGTKLIAIYIGNHFYFLLKKNEMIVV